MSGFNLQSNIPAFNAALKRKLSQAVDKTIKFGEGEIKTGMAEAKTGRVYGRHTASAPGEPPAIDTGFLANSIQSEMTGELSGVAGTNAEYAMHLEFGTVRMEPRPYFAPAFEEMKPVFEKLLSEAVK